MIAVGVVALIGCGLYSLDRIPIDAVPDITTNQVLVITNSPNLAAQEVEQFITFPLERSLANLPEVEEFDRCPDRAFRSSPWSLTTAWTPTAPGS